MFVVFVCLFVGFLGGGGGGGGGGAVGEEGLQQKITLAYNDLCIFVSYLCVTCLVFNSDH